MSILTCIGPRRSHTLAHCQHVVPSVATEDTDQQLQSLGSSKYECGVDAVDQLPAEGNVVSYDPPNDR